MGVAVPVPLLALAGAADATSIGSLAIVTAVYAAASSRPVRSLVPALAVVAACMTLAGVLVAADVGLSRAGALGFSLLQALLTIGAAVVVGSWVGALRESVRARAAQAEAIAREQDALVEAAVARERADMARELHDIAAHHLTGIAVLAGAVERQIDTDPAGAKQAVHQVRSQSTAVLRDLRSLVGLLRVREPDADARPETVAGIRHLVAEVTATGRDVELTVLGEEPDLGRDVGPLAQLAAYRAVQEALANAGRHAPGAPCRVTVDARADDAVVVTVRNAPAPAVPPASGGSGFGLLGMRERAQLTGATLDAGPTEDGGWQVTLRVPRERETS